MTIALVVVTVIAAVLLMECIGLRYLLRVARQNAEGWKASAASWKASSDQQESLLTLYRSQAVNRWRSVSAVTGDAHEGETRH